MSTRTKVANAPDLAFLSGGGEMGERIRSFDWSTTPLGPPARWPQSLKTAVRIMLASRQPIWIGWGAELIYLYNDPYKAIIGGRHPSALGKPTKSVWPELWDVIGPMLQAATSDGEGTYVEQQPLIMERHGFREETYYTYSYTPIPDDHGGAGGIICANTDDTQRVISQRQLALLREVSNATAAARSAEEASQLAASVFSAGSRDISFALIYLLDPSGERADLRATFGGPFSESIAPRSVSLTSADSLGQQFWPFERAFAGETIAVGDLDERAALPGGAWPEPTKTALVVPLSKGGGERPVGILVVGASPRRVLDERYWAFFDLLARNLTSAITAARAYQHERARAEALAELDRAKTAFFSNVSHEFRTPLTLLLGPLEDALREARATEDPARRERLELMRRNGLRLQKLVNTLLDFSRIEAGRIEASYEPTDLPAFTAQLVSMFDSATRRAGLRLRIDCPAASEPAYVDRDMWEKIVMNLLSNAFKFTLNGDIAVSVRQRGGAFELRVRDTGVGIPAEEMPRLFERFHRVRHAQARTHEGTGIGLAFTHELVRLHGGEIRVHSELGRGSEFIVRIPAGSAHLPADRIGTAKTLSPTALGATPFVEEALRWLPGGGTSGAAPEWLKDSSPSDRSSSVSCAGARILIADDNADMREYLSALLAPYWSVETAADGEAALQMVNQRAPELLVSDVMMPGLAGLELLEALREDERTRDLPVILLSARAGEEAAIEALKAGADAYLVKPFSARELVAYVDSHLQLQRLRKETHAAQRASEEKFSAAFNQSPLALTITSLADGRLVEVNDGFVRISGYTPEEAIGRTIDELRLWAEPERREEGLARLRAGGRISDAEVRFRRKDGEERVAMVGSALIDIKGAPHVLSSAVDITDRLRAESLIAADLHAFTRLHEIGTACVRPGHESQRCLGQILDTAIAFTRADKGTIQLFDADANALTIAANRGFETPFLDFFTAVGRDDATACGAAMRSGARIVVEDVTQSEVFAGQPTQTVLLDAGVRAVQSTPLISSAGTLLGMISTHFGTPHRIGEREMRLMDLLARQAADYLDRREADERLREHSAQLAALNATLQDADRRKDEFLAMLGHELRNPLAAVRNAVAIASLDESHRGRALDIARRQSEQLGRLIDDLLDVARITQGHISLRKERVYLGAILERAIQDTRSFIESRGVRLDLALPPARIALEADPARLEQVFVNLLLNAGKYTDAGGRISIAAQCGADDVTVRIRDTGIGITPEVLSRMWDLFAQADRSLDRSEGGLGIGLTIARRLVELHGGRIEAHSEGVGRGAEFIVTVPVLPAKTEEARPNAAAESLQGVRRSAHVLIVEDNRDAAESLTMLLEMLGHRVRAVYDGVAGLTAARASVPDVMLVDIGLPGMDGYDVARRVRRDPALKDVALVALTGYGRGEDKQQAMIAGFDYHLVKPVNPDALNDLLGQLGRPNAQDDRSPQLR